jgi:DNA-binding transcriptional ArsR family regulator
MSIKALSWALETTTGSPTTKLVLLYLADRYNDDERAAWPSVGTISRVTELSERTVRRAIADLLEQGLIESHGWTGTRADRQTKRDRLALWISPKTGGQSDTPQPLRGDTMTERGDRVTETGGQSDTQTLIEPLINPAEKISELKKQLKKAANQ